MIPTLPWLLVEDDLVDVMTVKRALTELQVPHPLHITHNGEEALVFLRTHPHALPGLILLDLNMPRMNGIELLTHLKADEELCRIPVVVFTTSKEEQDRMRSFQLSVAGYMAKPVHYRDFIEIIRSIREYWMHSEIAR